MLSFLYVYSDHSILECYNLFSGVELSMRSFLLLLLLLLKITYHSANLKLSAFVEFSVIYIQDEETDLTKLFLDVHIFLFAVFYCILAK